MAFSGEGAFGGGLGGAGAGAAIGAKFGSPTGPWGTAIGAGVGALAGALGGGLLGGGKKGRVPDISAEIARINALFERARAAQIASINRQAQLGRGAAASNLAARGVYSSPVSQNVFGGLEEARLGAIGEAEGRLAGQQAETEAKLLQALTGASIDDADRRDQARQGIFAALAGLGGSLLQGSLQGRDPQTPLAGRGQFSPFQSSPALQQRQATPLLQNRPGAGQREMFLQRLFGGL